MPADEPTLPLEPDFETRLSQARDKLQSAWRPLLGAPPCAPVDLAVLELAATAPREVATLLVKDERLREEKLHETTEEMLSYQCSWLTTTKREACRVLRGKVVKAVNMGTQMLANMMTCNPELQGKMWPHFFKDSDLLRQLLSTCDCESAKYVLMFIHNCIYKDSQQCLYLTQTSLGRDVLKSMLHTASQVVNSECATFDIIYSIFSNMIEVDLTPRILEALSYGKDPCRTHLFCNEHVTFLKLLDGMVDARANSDRPVVGVGIDTMVFLVRVFRKLVGNLERLVGGGGGGVVAMECDGVGGSDGGGKEREGGEKEGEKPMFGYDLEGVLLMLQFWGRVTQDLGPDAKVKLMMEGLGPALVQLLTLAHKYIPRTKLSKTSPSPSSSPPPTSRFSNPPCANPEDFGMLKTDIIKVIGNFSYEAREVQDQFRELEAIPLVLGQCNIDEYNPFLKEHAIFAIRNLCDGNAENQKIIEALEAREVVQDRVLDEAGVEAVIDETGKLRLKAKGRVVSRAGGVEEVVEDEEEGDGSDVGMGDGEVRRDDEGRRGEDVDVEGELEALKGAGARITEVEL
ncbi:hypothetical protein HDV00_008928 [Rhizophlyctis rosea]|nr:hypothetical protein HDV00_008928 [Rhizophlyctis rosea]